MVKYHKNAEDKVNQVVLQFTKRLRSQAEKIAQNRQHNEVQTVDVEDSITIIYHHPSPNWKQNVGIFAGQLVLGIALTKFIDALPRELVNGSIYVDRDGLLVWGFLVLTSTIISVISLKQS